MTAIGSVGLLAPAGTPRPIVDRLLKIDVEGAESLVFAGAHNLLSRADAPLIVCEVGDPAQRLVGTTELDLRKALYGYDYASYWLDGRKFGPETAVKGLQNIAFAKPRSRSVSP